MDDGCGTRIHTIDIEGTRGQSHEPTGQSSDLDGLSWHMAGPGQDAGPRHSTAPNGVGRGTLAGRGRTGSKAETRDGSGRAEPQSTMYRWRLVTFECQQTTVTELFSNDSTLHKDQVETWKDRLLVQATMITSHTARS